MRLALPPAAAVLTLIDTSWTKRSGSMSLSPITGTILPGQPATVKFTAYDYAIYGGMQAQLIGIGADSVTDSDGRAYYLVRVRTDKPSLGQDLPIIPGMVAQVDILTGKKTVLAYLMKPVLRAKANALKER